MPNYQLPSFFLLTPIFVIGGIIGWRRGWQREAITTICLFVAMVLLWGGPDPLLRLINAFVRRLAQVIAIILGSQTVLLPENLVAIPAGYDTLVMLVLICLAVVVCYQLGTYWGKGYKVDRSARWMGVMIGGLNFMLVLLRIAIALKIDLNNLSQIGPVNINIPAFPGARVTVPAPPADAMAGWPINSVAILLVVVLVIVLLRSARA